MRRPVLVDRHIPRELKALWQKIVLQLLTAEQSRTDVYPIATDLVFILPKLLLSHPLGKEKARDRLHRIQNSFQKLRFPNMNKMKASHSPRVLTAFLRGQPEDFTKQRPRDS